MLRSLAIHFLASGPIVEISPYKQFDNGDFSRELFIARDVTINKGYA